MTVQFLEPAQAELEDAVRFYEAQVEGLGAAFAREVQRALSVIEALPHAWHPLTPRLRRYQTRRFPYGLIYSSDGSGVLIVAVAHLHRRPNYWADRLA